MTSPWLRNAKPEGLCRCDHGEAEHRIDLKRMKCNRGGCDCPDYELVALLWREHRTVREEVA